MIRKNFTALLIALALALQFGCATVQARDQSPAVKYYAAVADWNAGKSLALHYVRNQAVPVAHIEAILLVVDRGDEAIAVLEEARGVRELTGSDYAAASAILRSVLLELNRHVVKEVSS